MLKEQQITSFSQAACLFRALRRPIVDELFDKRNTPRKGPNGKRIYPSRKERAKYDYEARQLWRAIIIESNNL